MRESFLIEKKEVICHCSCTTKAQILKLIAQGADSVEKISYLTGAAAGCGACEAWIEALLAQDMTDE